MTVKLKALAPGAAQLRLESLEPITLGDGAPRLVLPQTLSVQVK